MLLNCGVGEDSLESPLDFKDIKLINPKGNQSWVFIGRTDAEASASILWPSDVKNWLIWKHIDARKDQRWEEKGTTEDEMVGWHHQLDGHKFEQALWVGDGQGSLACCSPWGHKKLDMTEQLNWMCVCVYIYTWKAKRCSKEAITMKGEIRGKDRCQLWRRKWGRESKMVISLTIC